MRQKYGILRIYSGKGKWGHKQLDEWVIYSWSLAGFFYLFASQAEIEGRLMHYLNLLGVEVLYIGIIAITIGWVIYQWQSKEGKVKPALQFLAVIVLISAINPSANLAMQVGYTISIAATLIWLIYEWRSPNPLNVPKLLFLLSVVFMYGIAPMLSADAMADSTAFSHAAEYIAIVGLTVQNKKRINAKNAPLLSLSGKHILFFTVLFLVIISSLLYGLKHFFFTGFLIFTYGTSFTHYIFDGMIWKLRRPSVAQEVGTTSTG